MARSGGGGWLTLTTIYHDLMCMYKLCLVHCNYCFAQSEGRNTVSRVYVTLILLLLQSPSLYSCKDGWMCTLTIIMVHVEYHSTVYASVLLPYIYT